LRPTPLNNTKRDQFHRNIVIYKDKKENV
jgi:hypothetical protein